MEYILYRWWDSDGRLLYVGKSVSVFKRISEHRRGSAFFAEAAHMTLERFGSAELLNQAEINAIRAERPDYNKQYAIPFNAAKQRTITVLDGPPPALDTSLSHWSPASIDDISWGDIIRCVDSDGVVVVQGLVDDDVWDEYIEEIPISDIDDEEPEFNPGPHGWAVLTDEGEWQDVWHIDADGLWDLYKWVEVGAESELRSSIWRAYFDNIDAQIAKEVA